MASLRKFLWKNYSWIEKRILPKRENPQDVYRAEVEMRLAGHVDWLDLGCGYKLLPLTMANPAQRQLGMIRKCRFVCGMDSDHDSLKQNELIQNRVLGDILRLPFGDESFDLVTANMVVEHLETPDPLLAEIGRVLKPDGVFIVHTPNARSYKITLARSFPGGLKRLIINFLQNRRENDVYPAYYRMNTIERQREAAGANGFGLLEYRMLQGSAESVMLGPLVIFELLLMKILACERFCNYRSNIVSVFERSGTNHRAEKVAPARVGLG